MQSESEGIAKLRKGALMLIIAPILVAGGVILVYFTSAASLISTLSSLSKISSTNSAPMVSTLSSLISSILSPNSFTSLASITLMTIGIIAFVGFILVIIGYWYLRRGFKILKTLGKSGGIGHASTTLFFSFLVFSILGFLILVGISLGTTETASNNLRTAYDLLEAGFLLGAVMEGIGFLLLFISNILLGIGFYQVGGVYKESATKIGGMFILMAEILGIIFVLLPSNVSVVAPFLFFVGLILVYAGLRRISPAQTAQQMQQTPRVQQPQQVQPIFPNQQPPSVPQPQPVKTDQQNPPIQQPVSADQQALQPQQIPQTPPSQNQPIQTPANPEVYQVGQGMIRGDGVAYLVIYSTAQATVLSARIEGTNINSVSIMPSDLIPGQNGVVIKFDNVSSLNPGTTYLITITMNVGGNASEMKTVAIYQP